ncbi:MAG: O-methyltransferase [Gemmatimonadaceae bacterium]
MPDSPLPIWNTVESYLNSHLIPVDPVLDAALADATVAGLPPISVTAAEGRFLNLLVRMRGARRILEIGTLGGYSTIWMARALPADGILVTLEISDHHASVARRNIERAKLTARVDVRVAPALESLAALQAEGGDCFDLVFIDADKENSTSYFEAALQLTKRGSVIIVDNVVRDGEVVNEESTSTSAQGIRQLLEMLRSEGRVEATALQTVGSKGYDGFLLSVVKLDR